MQLPLCLQKPRPKKLRAAAYTVPGCYATTAECVALAQGAKRAGYCIYETAGAPDIAKNVAEGNNPMEALIEIGMETPVSYLCNEQGMRGSLEWLEQVHASGARVYGQVFNRAQGLLLALDGVINVFDVRSPTCKIVILSRFACCPSR